MKWNIVTARATYRKWWAGKYVRLRNQDHFFYCQDVEVSGPYSFVYGCAYLVRPDGHSTPVTSCDGSDPFRPRKKDVEVWDGESPLTVPGKSTLAQPPEGA